MKSSQRARPRPLLARAGEAAAGLEAPRHLLGPSWAGWAIVCRGERKRSVATRRHSFLPRRQSGEQRTAQRTGIVKLRGRSFILLGPSCKYGDGVRFHLGRSPRGGGGWLVTQLPEGRGGAGELVATGRRNPVSGGSLRPGEEAVGLLRFVTPCGQAMTPHGRCHDTSWEVS